MAGTHPDRATAIEHRDRGADLLAKLTRRCINDTEEDGILRHSCYSKPHGLGVDGSVSFGDFYVGLALALAIGNLELRTVLGVEPAVAIQPVHPEAATAS